jgi:hypothetical protein
MVPVLANVTAYPEVTVIGIAPSTGSAQVRLIRGSALFFEGLFLLLWHELLPWLAV